MRIGIIGLGLMGGSIAKAARVANWTVFASDVDPRVLSSAHAEGIIEEETDWFQWISSVHAVVLAVPINQVAVWVERIQTRMKGAGSPPYLVDISSVKGPLLATFENLEPPWGVLSIHPMAGKEQRGYEHSDANLFRGFPCAAVAVNGSLDYDALTEWMGVLGTYPLVVAASIHDRIVSLVSHLPYLVSAALLATIARNGEELQWTTLVGSGFLDTTRVGASDFDLFREIVEANRSAVSEGFHAFRLLIDRWDDSMQQGQWPPELDETPQIRRRAIAERMS